MALLKKIQSATLIETLIATILIVVVFMIASLILNNLLYNSFSKKTHTIENKMYELNYKIEHGMVKLPYKGEFENWIIIAQVDNKGKMPWLYMNAANSKTNSSVAIKKAYVQK